MFYCFRGKGFIQEYEREQAFISGLKSLQKKKGSNLIEFLGEVRCANDEVELEAYLDSVGEHELPACQTLQEYERNPYKAYKGHRLSPRASTYEKVSSYLKQYTDELEKLYEEYFNQHSPTLALFKTLAPKHWKKRMPRDEPMKILNLAKLLGVSTTVFNIQDEWTKFRNELIESEFFCGSSDDLLSKPEEFWTSILNSKTTYVPRIIRQILEKVLVTPLGSRYKKYCKYY